MSPSEHPVYLSPHASLFRDRRASTHRSSSWDTTGGNLDYVGVSPGEAHTLLDVSGPGCVTHLYCAFVLPDLRDYRNAILRCFWDGSEIPAVEVPLGDFFCLAHGRSREFTSSMVSVNGGFGGSQGLNAYFPMPFSDGARITLENRGSEPLGGVYGALWFHVEYERYDHPLPADVQRFHASWRQERPTGAVGPETNLTLHDAKNLTGAENFVALDTTGEGRMVGLHLQIENAHGPKWYGEGDDMVFIDGEPWPPSIHGTGTEEIFGGGACPTYEYTATHSGFHLVESSDFSGLVGMYRWFVHDPIHFQSSIRWTLEHGHANNFANNYTSVAYWYQTATATLPTLPAASDMLPALDWRYDEIFAELRRLAGQTTSGAERHALLFDLAKVAYHTMRGEFATAHELLLGTRREET